MPWYRCSGWKHELWALSNDMKHGLHLFATLPETWPTIQDLHGSLQQPKTLESWKGNRDSTTGVDIGRHAFSLASSASSAAFCCSAKALQSDSCKLHPCMWPTESQLVPAIARKPCRKVRVLCMAFTFRSFSSKQLSWWIFVAAAYTPDDALNEATVRWSPCIV